MSRSEPPLLATWMLEHCVPAEHAGALAGDLLEGFRAGRSRGWFWRQTLSACAVSWAEDLRERMSMLLFALIWSMFAPAWKAFIDGFDNASVFDRLLVHLGPFWVVAGFAGWLLLHSIFLWTGILVFYVANTSLGRTFPSARIGRPFLLAPIVFAPVYGATMVWGSLYWYSFFADAKLAATPLGQIADLQMLANVMRLPFFIALVAALWNLVPKQARALQSLLRESRLLSSSAPASLTLSALRRFFAFFVSAGLINAMIAAFVLCQLPESHAPTIQTLLGRAIMHVAIGALAGVIGAYLYWYSPASPFRTDPPLPFSLFAMVCAAGWIWVPAMALFSEQLSGATALVAGVGAFFLAVGLRQSTFSFIAQTRQIIPAEVRQESELFAESLALPRSEPYGYVISISFFAAFMALAARQNAIAAALLATGTFLFAWKRTYVSSAGPAHLFGRTARRLAFVAIPAVLVTAWALLDGVAHRNLSKVAGVPPVDHAQAALVDPSQRAQQKPGSAGAGGYESLILWPYPEKKPIVAPIPVQTSILAPGTTQPLIIRFDGPYWYLQPPDKRPGPTAHEAHGTPLAAEIRSVNELPLVMDAHQPLGSPIPINRCREIEVQIENRDKRTGSIEMAVLLADTSSKANPELYLGQQPIVPTQAEPTLAQTASAPEPAGSIQTLRFPIPAAAKIRKFNEITVMLLLDRDRAQVGPRIAVRQFQLFPR